MNADAKPPETRSSYLNIVASEKGLTELDRGKTIVFIPKIQVQSVEVKFGSRAENPLMQSLFGLAMGCLGLVGLFLLVKGGIGSLRWGIGFIFFGGLGAFCVFEVLKKGYYLRVVTANESRKLTFKGEVEKTELLNFVNASSQIGYHFQNSLCDKKF